MRVRSSTARAGIGTLPRARPQSCETTCVIHGREVNDQLARLFEAGLAEAEEVTLDAVARRGRLVSLAEAAMNLVSPLL